MSEASIPTLAASDVAWITADEMREVDRIMIEDLHIELLQMMENAGRSLARLIVDVMSPASVSVYAGTGGNAGGGLVAARHLHTMGLETTVVLTGGASRLGPVPAHQLDILERMGVAVGTDVTRADVAIDALIGYGLSGDPRGRTAELIDELNRGHAVVSLDVPSGLDSTTGRRAAPCVRAGSTLTLALPKTGLRDAPQVGRLFLADISVPPSVYAGIGAELVPDFRDGPIVEVTLASAPGTLPTEPAHR